MLAKVIYRDGTVGNVESSTIDHLIHMGRIGAYQVLDRWIEVKRKQRANPDYQGPERRKYGLL